MHLRILRDDYQMASRSYICPVQNCGADTSVVRTKSYPDQIVRERVCVKGHRHETSESRLDRPLQVLRSENAESRTEPWDREKARKSIALAASNQLRPDDINSALDGAVIALLGKMPPGRPIPTKLLGEEIIRQLRISSPSAAVRYATKFYPSRPESDLRIETVQQLAELFTDKFGWHDLPQPNGAGRPSIVKKRPRVNQPHSWHESFELQKLWNSLVLATKGMIETSKWQPPGELTHPERFDRFIAALVQQVLQKVHGQTTVTSGQLSTACIEVLAEVHPLGAVRFSTAAKLLADRRELLAEIVDMAERERQSDLASVRAKWDQLDADELDGLISELGEAAQ